MKVAKYNFELVVNLAMVLTLVILCFSCQSDYQATTSKSASYYIGGSVQGLNGSLLLSNSTGESLTITADGAFGFSQPVSDAYLLTIDSAPSPQVCQINPASGLISSDVQDILVTCSDAYSIIVRTSDFPGGSLPVTAYLQNGEAVNISTANQDFTFNTKLAVNASYAVTIDTNSGYYCTASNSNGIMGAADINVDFNNCQITKTVYMLTDQVNNGDLGGIEEADDLCDRGQDRPKPSSTYQAFLFDSTNRKACSSSKCTVGLPAGWVLQADTAYLDDRGREIFSTDSVALPNNSIEAVNNLLTDKDPQLFFTGIDDFFQLDNNCNDWGASSGTAAVGINDSRNLSNFFFEQDAFDCSLPAALLCIEQ